MGGVRWEGGDAHERAMRAVSERDRETLALAFFRCTVSAVLHRAVLRDEDRLARQAAERLLIEQENWDTYFKGER